MNFINHNWCESIEFTFAPKNLLSPYCRMTFYPFVIGAIYGISLVSTTVKTDGKCMQFLGVTGRFSFPLNRRPILLLVFPLLPLYWQALFMGWYFFSTTDKLMIYFLFEVLLHALEANCMFLSIPSRLNFFFFFFKIMRLGLIIPFFEPSPHLRSSVVPKLDNQSCVTQYWVLKSVVLYFIWSMGYIYIYRQTDNVESFNHRMV